MTQIQKLKKKKKTLRIKMERKKLKETERLTFITQGIKIKEK